MTKKATRDDDAEKHNLFKPKPVNLVTFNCDSKVSNIKLKLPCFFFATINIKLKVYLKKKRNFQCKIKETELRLY